jgi:hypothetical protein
VGGLADVVVEAARPLYRFVAPQPSFHARRVLTRIGDRVPAPLAQIAGEILSEDVQYGTPLAGDASKALIELLRRELFDAVPVLVDALLDGRDLPVTIAGWLRDAPKQQRRPLLKAALAGNVVALQEAARAGLPESDAKLRARCDNVVRASVKATDSSTNQSFGVSFVHLADMASFCGPRLQGRFVDMLLDVVRRDACDEISKINALTTMSILSRRLAQTPAKRALRTLQPIARGAPVVSAPKRSPTTAIPSGRATG